MTQTYVLVADSTRARVFARSADSGALQEIDDLVHPQGRLHARDLTAGSPGRTRDRSGQGRHALEDPTDPKHTELLVFVRQIAQYCKELRTREPGMELIVVAGAELRGLLHKQFDASTAKAVKQEVDKNLAQLSAEEISTRLGSKH